MYIVMPDKCHTVHTILRNFTYNYAFALFFWDGTLEERHTISMHVFTSQICDTHQVIITKLKNYFLDIALYYNTLLRPQRTCRHPNLMSQFPSL